MPPWHEWECVARSEEVRSEGERETPRIWRARAGAWVSLQGWRGSGLDDGSVDHLDRIEEGHSRAQFCAHLFDGVVTL